MNRRARYRAATIRAFAIEDLIADLFRRLDYEVSIEAEVSDIAVDMLVERDGRRRPVEVVVASDASAIQKLRTDAERLRSIIKLEPALGKPIIALVSPISNSAKDWTQKLYDIDVWDLDTIRGYAATFPDLLTRLDNLTGVGGTPAAQDLDASINTKLQASLGDHILENTLTDSQYEDLCLSAFMHLFDPNLYGFEKQARTTDGGNRYDFICRIQPGNSFWDGLRSDFRTKAILFECKNYSVPITADQVYSTERYLFAGALRTVCFLISRLAPSTSALRAAQGAMRESGKLVLLLSNIDLIEMLKLKSQPEAAENYLDKKIWDFIISLPR